MVKNECEHGKGKYKCRTCNPSAFCEHEKYKYICRLCKPDMKKKTNKFRKKCEHNKRKDSCNLCSGCVHKKLICIECTPLHFCKHKKRKTICKNCNGGSICEHKRIRSTCKECDGGSFCIHKIKRSTCYDCSETKVSFCVHKILKYFCVECEGTQICVHKKLRKLCKECYGKSFCEHKKNKFFCKTCKGNGICEHNIRKYDCKFCNPYCHFINLQRGRIRQILKTIGKVEHTTVYLGCSSNQFYDYIVSKMTPEMNISNIHLDHIKPVSKFDLSSIDEIYKCCHWSNIQPMLAIDNLRKSNKWTNADEENWRKNIIKYNSEQRVSVDKT